MAWSPQQEQALKLVRRWIEDPAAPQVFYLAGYAGTGKTTLAKHFAEGIDGRVVFGAFTGKAALVLRTKGCRGASTIHSMIYKLDDERYGQPRFVINKDSIVKDAELVIIDEVSMVDEELGRDLLSFRRPVLVLGDPAQLPPVKGAGFFTRGEPDFMLTEVHRQAADNPIIRMSMMVREGKRLDQGDYGACRVIDRDLLDQDEVVRADQLLVGLNKTRRIFNRRMRALQGRPAEDLPVAGERLVCLRNNSQKGLLNGGIWNVEEVTGWHGDLLAMGVEPIDLGMKKVAVEIEVHPFFFEGRETELEWGDRRKSDEFDFAYALTVHKSQGSQWDNIVLFDESGTFRDDRARWLYTGITRAAERITIVQS